MPATLMPLLPEQRALSATRGHATPMFSPRPMPPPQPFSFLSVFHCFSLTPFHAADDATLPADDADTAASTAVDAAVSRRCQLSADAASQTFRQPRDSRRLTAPMMMRRYAAELI
jgi:hypothetical protein